MEPVYVHRVIGTPYVNSIQNLRRYQYVHSDIRETRRHQFHGARCQLYIWSTY